MRGKEEERNIGWRGCRGGGWGGDGIELTGGVLGGAWKGVRATVSSAQFCLFTEKRQKVQKFTVIICSFLAEKRLFIFF